MLKSIRRLFGEKGSSEIARERMQVVLIHDRLDLTPNIMESIKNDILSVLSRYMEIDSDTIHVQVKQEDDCIALVSNVQVKRVYPQDDP